ncbi:MAG: PIN domain-containing protein [Thermoproteus sp.]
MIIDTTYILPLAGVEVKRDLLKAIVEGKTDLRLGDLGVSLASVLELQAKAAKLGVPAQRVVRAIRAVFSTFDVVPFYEKEVVEIAAELSRRLDYIDAVIAATAAARGEDLVTEDSEIHKAKDLIRSYGVNVLKYADVVKPRGT